ncbi:MAG: hypothetical protein IJO33_02605 [Bacilli bacterium]|nr:hypothetical protein [Bacilli bacterium]
MSLILSNCINQKYLYEQVNMLNDPNVIDKMTNEEKIAAYKKYKDYLINQNYFVQSVGSLFWDVTGESVGDLSFIDELIKLLKNPCLSSGLEFDYPILIGLDDLHKSYIPRFSKKELKQFIFENRFRTSQTSLTSQKAYVLKLILLHNLPVIDNETIEILESKLYTSEFTEKRNWYGLKDFVDKQIVSKRKDSILFSEEQSMNLLIINAENIICSEKMVAWQNLISLCKGHILYRYLPLSLDIIKDIKNNGLSEESLFRLDLNLPMPIKEQLRDFIYFFAGIEEQIDEESEYKRILKFKDNLCKASINRF